LCAVLWQSSSSGLHERGLVIPFFVQEILEDRGLCTALDAQMTVGLRALVPGLV